MTKGKPSALSAGSSAHRWPLLLCAVVLVLSQSLLQLHGVKHFAGDAGDTDSCQLCLSGGSLGNAVSDSAHAGLTPCNAIVPYFVERVATSLSVAFSFRQRAPPLVSLTT